MHVIYNRKNRLYWSNDMGWVDKQSATKYDDQEVKEINYLPANSQWENLSTQKVDHKKCTK